MKQSLARPPQLAGTWYTGSPQALRREVGGYILSAEIPPFPEEVIALVAPHAGHRYSGPVAGYAYRAVQNQTFASVVVVSPFHHRYHHPLLTTAHSVYQTPLGDIAVDASLIETLETTLGKRFDLALDRLAFDQEHSIEIQLPFLQCALEGEFKLLPLMLSTARVEAAVQLGEALGEVLAGKDTLLVASTDLSHFYAEETANRLDHAMLDAVASLDPQKVIAVQRSGKGEACGLLAVIAVLTAANALGAAQCRILNYATSGVTSGDYNRVVGYGAAVITR